MRKSVSILIAPLLAAALSGALFGCAAEGPELHNGYYSAVAEEYNADGWKEFITLYVYNNRVITVEYNARNASGFILSWDGLSMRRLVRQTNLHPNRVVRAYSQELLNRQDPGKIRPVPGDAYFYKPFKALAAAALEHAKAGNKTVATVRFAENAAVPL